LRGEKSIKPQHQRCGLFFAENAPVFMPENFNQALCLITVVLKRKYAALGFSLRQNAALPASCP
jgi:hypothetical protein